MWDVFDFIIYELLGKLIGKFRLSMGPGWIILSGVICTLVGALLFLFSDTLFSGETIVLYVGVVGISMCIGGLVATVVGVIQALIGVIRALIVKIRGG